MIDLNAVKQKARLIVADSVHTNFSNYEVDEACEAAVNILVDSLVAVRSHLITSRADLERDEDGGFALPDDFVAVDRVRDNLGRTFDYRTRIDRYETYCIEKGRLIMQPDSVAVSLSYFAKPKIEVQDDGIMTLDLPEYFRDPLSRITASVLGNDYDAAESLALKTCLTSRVREVGRYPLPPLWGGYDRYA